MTGTRCNRWLCIRPIEKTREGQWKWECQCDCGNIRVVRGGDLRSGGSKSCGCYAVKVVSKYIHKDNEYPQRHKHSKDKLYRIWSGMIQRYIRHPIKDGYKICDEWYSDSVAFIRDLEKMGWSPKMEIQLKEGENTYSPDTIYLSPKGSKLSKFHSMNNPEMRNLKGRRFGHLIVIEEVNDNGNLYANCLCDCGNTVTTYVRHLVYGQTSTCGCKYGGKWSMYHEKCQSCKRTDRPHHSRGICSGCRSRLRKNGEWDNYKATKSPYNFKK